MPFTYVYIFMFVSINTIINATFQHKERISNNFLKMLDVRHGEERIQDFQKGRRGGGVKNISTK